jgi:hypothetical protein
MMGLKTSEENQKKTKIGITKCFLGRKSKRIKGHF